MTFAIPEPPVTGNGYPSFKWSRIGDTIVGSITLVNLGKDNKGVPIKNKFDPSKPDDMNVVLEIHTDEPVQSTDRTGAVTTGQDWTVFLKIGGQMYAEFAEKVTAAGGLTLGSRIAIRFVSEEDTGKGNPMKVYAVDYKRAAAVPAPAAEASSAPLSSLL